MALLSFRELSLLAEAEFSIEKTRQDLGAIVDWFRAKSYHTLAIQSVSTARRLDPEILESQKMFFVDEDLTLEDIPDDFKSEALGLVRNNYITYSGRAVFPVFDVRGQVMGFCGWDKWAEGVKYLDSKNHGYKAKVSCFYGMEKLEEYYRSGKPVFFTEGIMCCLYLRMKGFQAVSILGSKLYPYVVEIIKRFGSNAIIVPDNDIIGKSVEDIAANPKPAGESFVQAAKRYLPNAVVIQSLIDKDIDDSRLHEDKEGLLLKELAMLPNPFMPYSTIRIR